MPFSVSCPECHYQFRVPDHVAGQRGKCPKCKAMFLAVRAGDGATATGSAEAAPTKAAANSAAVSIGDDETLVAKPRTLSIPKPRLLEKIAAPPPVDVPLELVEPDDANFGAASPAPAVTPPPAPPAPPRGARRRPRREGFGDECSGRVAPPRCN